VPGIGPATEGSLPHQPRRRSPPAPRTLRKGWRPTPTCVEPHRAAHQLTMKGTGMVDEPAAQYFAPGATPALAPGMRE
jgi:hypothetical protein